MTKVGAIIAREIEESEARGRKTGRIEGRTEGRTEGLSAALLTVLTSKGEVSEQLKRRIREEKKNELLDQWLRIAATAPDVGAFEKQITR